MSDKKLWKAHPYVRGLEKDHQGIAERYKLLNLTVERFLCILLVWKYKEQTLTE